MPPAAKDAAKENRTPTNKAAGKKDDNKGVSDELKQRVDDLETLLHNSLGGIAAIQADMAAIPKILEAVKKAKADGKL